MAIPESWEITPLEAIVSSVKGKKPRELSIEKGENSVPYIDIAAFERNIIRQWADIKSSQIVTNEQILVVWDGARSGLAGMGKSGALGSTLVALSTKELNPSYILYFLQSQYNYINSNPRGTGIPHVDPEIFWKIEVPLPPLNEQRRIVEKLDEIMGRLSTARAKLERVPHLLAHFRRAILSAACSGALTRDWREKNGDIDSWGTGIEVCNQVDGLEKWRQVSFGSILSELRNGISTKPEMNPPGLPILRISAARGGCVDLTDFRYLPNSEHLVKTYSLRDGDLLFTRYNGTLELLGVCGKVRGLDSKVVLYPDKLMRARFTHPHVLPDYIEIYFQSPRVRDKVTEKSKSSAGQNGVSGSDLKAIEINFPPLPEQVEIVRRVNELFTLADAIEARYKKAKAHFDRMPVAILAKAFRGELVPQDPDDESAELLLERLRAAKAETKTVKGKSSPPKKAKAKPPEQGTLF